MFNAEGSIRRTLDSVATQAPYVDEVLVIDDGSDDGTAEIVREYRQSVTLLVEPHRGDPAIPRNIGVQRASNDLIAFLDADDVWLPGKLGAQISAVASDPAVGLVCTNAFRQTQPAVFDDLATLLPRGAGASGDVLPRLLANNFVITSSVLACKAALQEAGPFYSGGGGGAEDYGVWLRLARVCRFAYLEQPWLVYRDCGLSYRLRWSEAENALALLDDLDRLEERFPELRRSTPRSSVRAAVNSTASSDVSRSQVATAVLQFAHSRQHFGSGRRIWERGGAFSAPCCRQMRHPAAPDDERAASTCCRSARA